jgi:hypothetical protein
MHPYRTPPGSLHDEPPEGMFSEERALLWMVIVLGGVRVVVAVIARQEFGAEPTAALIGLFAGIWLGRGHATRWWRRRRSR